MKNYLEEAAEAAKAARLIAEKADHENREMTEAERAEFDAKFAEATEKKARHERQKAAYHGSKQWAIDQQKFVRDITAQIGGIPGTGGGNGSTWAKTATERLEKSMHEVDGQKAVVSGTYGVPNIIDPDIVSMAQVPTSLLELIPIKGAPSDGRGGNTFTFLRQTVRTNNAAVVADNATKPTSVYTMGELEDRFRVVAHLSEAIPLRYFADHNQLEDWLQSEMEYGLMRAVEAEVLGGDGTGEHFTGILNTSGIIAQAFATDVLTTTRKTKTALENQGQKPSAFVFNPADNEAIDLLKDTNGQFYGSGPFTGGPSTLWGLPRVSSTALTAGQALLADWSQAELLVREGATLAVDTGGDLFDKNQAKMRVEGRFGLAVKRPAAFATIDLTA